MTRQPELALALLRLVVGVLFAAHGAQTIFLKGLGPVTQQFQTWQVPLPLLTAPLVATLELAGGVLLVLGLGARAIALALAAVMAGAIYFAHWGKDFWAAGGIQLPILLLGASLAIVLGGPGKPSFDQLGSRRSGAPPPAPAAKPKSGRSKGT